MNGVVIVPSRGRPWNVAELIDAFDRTGAFEDGPDLVIAVDSNDPEVERYHDASGPLLHVGEPDRMGPVLNREAVRLAPRYDWVGFMGDDHRPRTPLWWRYVDEALSAGPGVVYGDDLFQGPRLPTAVFMSSSIIQRLGYMHPPNLKHLFLDNAWVVIGHATRLVYDDRMVIEHVHPFAGKAEMDEGYRANNSHTTIDHDQAEFARYLAEDWPTEQLKLTRDHQTA